MKFQCPFSAARIAIAAAIPGGTGLGSDENKVRLMKNNPAISLGTVIGDIEEADYSAYTPVATGDIAEVVTDLEIQKLLLELYTPAAGYRFPTDLDAAGLPQTVYGVYLTDADATVLLAVAKFTTPIMINAINEEINVGKLQLLFADTFFAS